MPKTRLNGTKRVALKKFAREMIAKTPDNPKLIKDVDDAYKAYVDAGKKLRQEAKKAIDKAVNQADLKVLVKYNVYSQTSPSLHNRVCFAAGSEVFEVPMSPTMEEWDRTVELDTKTGNKYDSLLEKETIKLPPGYGMSGSNGKLYIGQVGIGEIQRKPIPALDSLKKLCDAYEAAEREYEMAKCSLDEKRQDIKHIYYSLIDASKYFEDVIEIWPEAKKIGHKIVAESTALTVLSDEAIETLKAHAKQRGKQ